MTKHNKRININTILRILNLIVFILTCYFYINKSSESNPYVNDTSLLILILLFIQTELILMLERFRKNPFIIILIFNYILFYQLRILTLMIFPESAEITFSRFGEIGSNDLNNTLFFIYLSLWMIFLGLFIKSTKSTISIEERQINALMSNIKPNIMLFVFAMSIILSLLLSFCFALGRTEFRDYSKIASYINVFFNSEYLLMTTLVYFGTFRGKLNKYLSFFIVTLVCFIMLRILQGSRSSILSTGYIILISILAVQNTVYLKRKIVVWLIVLIIISPITFYLGNIMRTAKNLQDTKILSLEQYIDYLTTVDHTLMLKENERIFSEIAGRAGLLDYATDIIYNSDKYSQTINFGHYFESIIDASTPGFDIFNKPLAANALRYLYGGGKISRIGDTYHSDQMTIFAEYYVLFGGYLAVFMFAMVAFGFRYTYLSIKFKDPFIQNMAKAFILKVYLDWLGSFGTDWIFVEFTRGIFILIFQYYLLKKISTISSLSNLKTFIKCTS